MTRPGYGRDTMARVLPAILAALMLAGSSQAFGASTGPTAKPRVSTGGVKHVRGSSGELDAVIDPNGAETSYFFQYGPTIAYGSQTKPAPVGNGIKGVRVGQPVTGLLTGYHYRAVATTTAGVTVLGKDKIFTGGKSSRLKVNLPKGKEEELIVSYGGSVSLAGSLSGLGNAAHGVTLQSSPYPFTSPFTTLAGPLLTTPTGGFVFKLSRLTQNTELRVLTVDARPIYSSVITVHVTPLIRLHVQALHGKRYRLYGTVSPAKLSGLVTIQQLTPQKAGSKRSGPKPHAIGTTTLKKGTPGSAKFSTVMSGLTGTFHYRAYIKLTKGPLDSGHSNNVLIRGPRATSKRTHKHKHEHRKRKRK